ncbi:MAG: hypothetical protein DI628_06405 [Blastochloris viridis]|uniref:DUF1311 domain-containing protein n=1 Tax=Blastochloris viridis TaxID=1079 RepID=A0A6N4RBU2_BLAVI|nr:MAG: hypothetical protein DI628_06405 [Blastochloris viridis]
MKKTLMAAAAVFCVSASVPVFAQEAVPVAKAAAVAKDSCPFGGSGSDLDCAGSASKAFLDFAGEVKGGDASSYLEHETKMVELRQTYFDWFGALDPSGLGKDEPLRVVVEKANKNVALAERNLDTLRKSVRKSVDVKLPKS